VNIPIRPGHARWCLAYTYLHPIDDCDCYATDPLSLEWRAAAIAKAMGDNATGETE